jgi:hypothetical protein
MSSHTKWIEEGILGVIFDYGPSMVLTELSRTVVRVAASVVPLAVVQRLN